MDTQVLFIVAQLSFFTIFSSLIMHAKDLEKFYEISDAIGDKIKLEKIFDAHQDAVIVASCGENVSKPDIKHAESVQTNPNELHILF